MMKEHLKKIGLISFLLSWRARFFTFREHYLFSSNFRKKFGSCPASCQILPPVYITTPQNVFLEENVRIQTNVSIINSDKGKVIIKRYSAISAGCTIIPGNHIPTVGIPHFFVNKHTNDVDRCIVIEEDCWVGADVRLLSKAHIGRGCIVATGSIVTKEIPPYAIVVGSPAKIIAVKFSIVQILEHERWLYTEHERFSKEYLEKLFDEYYNTMPVMGENKYSEDELQKIWQQLDHKS